MNSWRLFSVLALVAAVTACEVGYTRITNSYREPIRLEVYTTASPDPTDLILPPGKQIIYRDRRIAIRSIEVFAPNGEIKSYDSEALKYLAAAAHQKLEAIQWSLKPEGLFAYSP